MTNPKNDEMPDSRELVLTTRAQTVPGRPSFGERFASLKRKLKENVPIFRDNYDAVVALRGDADPDPFGRNLPVLNASTSAAAPKLQLTCVSIENFEWAQIESLFPKGVQPQPFNPKRSYYVRTYTPPKGSRLFFLLRRLGEALGQKHPPRLQMLREKAAEDRIVASDLSETEKELITSCVHLTKPTPWLEVLPVTREIEKFGVQFYEGKADPVIIRILPANKDLGFFEAQVIFRHDPKKIPVKLSDLVATYAMNSDSVIGPLSQTARNYLDAQGPNDLIDKFEPLQEEGLRPTMEYVPLKVAPSPSKPNLLAAPKPKTKLKTKKPVEAPAESEQAPPIDLGKATVVKAETPSEAPVPPVVEAEAPPNSVH